MKTLSCFGRLLVNISQAGLEPTDQAISTIAERIGFAIQRRPGGPVLPFSTGLAPLAAQSMARSANGQIASTAAADLAQAFRGSFAPVRQAVLESKSAAELLARIDALYSDLSLEQLAKIKERALVAFAANGSIL